jgi:uncharacterized protein
MMQDEDSRLRGILQRSRTIALVGYSANPARPSAIVGQFLHDQGYHVIAVNPGLVGQMALGGPVYGALADIPDRVDMVDIFRASDAVPDIVQAALARWSDLGVIWLQLGVSHPQAEALARARGVDVVADRCPKIEYQRLLA